MSVSVPYPEVMFMGQWGDRGRCRGTSPSIFKLENINSFSLLLLIFCYSLHKSILKISYVAIAILGPMGDILALTKLTVLLKKHD